MRRSQCVTVKYNVAVVTVDVKFCSAVVQAGVGVTSDEARRHISDPFDPF